MQPQRRTIVTTAVNATPVEALVDVRTTLADFLREETGCTSVHLGCEHGVCGACTVLHRWSARSFLSAFGRAGDRPCNHHA